MAKLELSNQSALAGSIQTKTNQLKNQMDLRLEMWQRMPQAKRAAWVKSGSDPVMTLAWQLYRYLRDNFFDDEGDHG